MLKIWDPNTYDINGSQEDFETIMSRAPVKDTEEE